MVALSQTGLLSTLRAWQRADVAFAERKQLCLFSSAGGIQAHGPSAALTLAREAQREEEPQAAPQPESPPLELLDSEARSLLEAMHATVGQCAQDRNATSACFVGASNATAFEIDVMRRLAGNVATAAWLLQVSLHVCTAVGLCTADGSRARYLLRMLPHCLSGSR